MGLGVARDRIFIERFLVEQQVKDRRDGGACGGRGRRHPAPVYPAR